jgi:uncharacterized protein (DUF2164 family)
MDNKKDEKRQQVKKAINEINYHSNFLIDRMCILECFETDASWKIEEMDDRLDDLEKIVDPGLFQLEEDIKHLSRKFYGIEDRKVGVLERLDKLEEKIKELEKKVNY